MTTTIQRLGDGLALPLPASITALAGFGADAAVDVTVENGAIVARPAGTKRYNLEELVAGMTEENRHGETDWGPDVGREVV